MYFFGRQGGTRTHIDTISTDYGNLLYKNSPVLAQAERNLVRCYLMYLLNNVECIIHSFVVGSTDMPFKSSICTVPILVPSASAPL